jgi:hypothetical protein
MVWAITVIGLCSLLLALLVWKEVRRSNKAWLVARILLSVLAVTALALLAFSLPVKKRESASAKDIVLLTEGFDKDSVERVVKQHKIQKIYTADKAIRDLSAIFIADLSLLKDSGHIVHLFGYGFTETEWRALHAMPVRFYPALLKNTFTAASWNRKLPSGEPLIVQGRFVNAGSLPAKFVLSGFESNLDSATVAANETGNFTLRAVPSHLNKAVFTLTALSGTDTLAKEPVPVEVLSTAPLKVLVLASSPDFENKFLKTWLADHQYGFAVRTTISSGKYDKEFVNLSPLPLDNITPDLLQKFDLLVADMSGLKALPSPGIAAIQSFVSNRGGGLVVKADNAARSSQFYAAAFPLAETRDSLQHLVKALFAEDDYATSPLKIGQPVYIKAAAGTQVLVQDQQRRTIVSSTQSGLGKIVLTTVPNSFVWQLSGSERDYHRYWTTLLTEAAKRTPSTNNWQLMTALPSVHDEVPLQWQGETDGAPQMQVGSATLYPEQDPHLPYRWRATFWPAAAGWVLATAANGKAEWFYVYGKEDWKGVKAAEKITATKQYAAAHEGAAGQSPTAVTIVKTEFPKIWLFLLVLLCCGLLWLEKKRQQT